MFIPMSFLYPSFFSFGDHKYDYLIFIPYLRHKIGDGKFVFSGDLKKVQMNFMLFAKLVSFD